MRTLMELLLERDLCMKELGRVDLKDPWARAFLAGAIQGLEWAINSRHRYTQRPSSFTRNGSDPDDA